MWTRVDLPSIDGPITGFTFPGADVMYLLITNGLLRLTLTPPAQARRVADAAELAEASGPRGLTWDGQRHFVYGDDSGDIPVLDHPNGDRIVPDPDDGTLMITDPDERIVRHRIRSIRLPTDNSWLYAG